MKTFERRTISLIMSVIMVLSCFAGMTFPVGAETSEDDESSDSMKQMIALMSVGDTFTFGSYPQTDVTDELGLELTAAAPSTDEWSSYNYYYNSEQSDYMKYYDLIYNEEMYRGVYFTQFRPLYWSTTNSAHQLENGYNTNSIYWFRYDSLTWRILDPSTGYVICDDIIDSQAFNNKYYEHGTDSYGQTAYYNDETYSHFANDWANSTIRVWLNETFFVTAFFSNERSQILSTKHTTTSAFSSYYSQYDVGETDDYVFLPSYQDVVNSSYGFSSINADSDIERRAHSSDYAKSQGVYVSTRSKDKNDNDTAYYSLRSAGCSSSCATEVIQPRLRPQRLVPSVLISVFAPLCVLIPHPQYRLTCIRKLR